MTAKVERLSPPQNIDAGTPDDFVNDLFLAKKFSTNRQFWQKLRREGGGPQFYRLSGRAVRYKLSEVERWVDSRSCSNTGEY